MESVLIYVDDLIGVCWSKDLQSKLAKSQLLWSTLLGPTAVSDEKTYSGRRIEIIGYFVDLDLGLVTIFGAKFLKAL